MEKNYTTKLAGQIGESLVVAELGRRGIIATAFSGNVPEIDLLAYRRGKTVALQVKAWRVGSVSVNASNYLKIEIFEESQNVIGLQDFKDESLIYAFVKIGRRLGEDSFYFLSKRSIADIIFKNYVEFLERHNGRRPRNFLSTHCVVNEADLLPFANNWGLIEREL